ncbi:MAG: response regulator transcription factor [Bacteroidales bacterium]|jgi:DNA-binding NarL/FixJ family response regulator|nr:response regulator transcription factor [Bacteroidales bacterium]
MIKAIIVDDHELFRLGVKTAIASRHPDIEIVAEADSGEELFRLLPQTAGFDMALLDIILPGMSGVETARRLKTERPEVKILALSAENSATSVQAMLDAGAEGFISKREGGVDALAGAIRAVSGGFNFFGKDISEIVYRVYVAKKKTAEVTSEFTEQEKRIIELCSDMATTSKQIAERLGISPRTVDTHKNNIFRKLGINSTAELIQYAARYGIIHMHA